MKKNKNTAKGELTVNKVVRVRTKGFFARVRTFRFVMFKYEAVAGKVLLNLVEMDTRRTVNIPLDNLAWLTATPATQADMTKRASAAAKKSVAEGKRLQKETDKLKREVAALSVDEVGDGDGDGDE